jgi:hypothetical protein
VPNKILIYGKRESVKGMEEGRKREGRMEGGRKGRKERRERGRKKEEERREGIKRKEDFRSG